MDKKLTPSLRWLTGKIASFSYNAVLSGLPSRRLRRSFLSLWLRKLGKGANVQRKCQFLNGRKISIGNNTVINFGCLLDGRSYSIEIGDNASIGPEASILTLGHDPQSVDFADKGAPVRIGKRAWIGYRAVILPGVEIGDGAVVGAGSIVSKNVPDFTIVAGNPARIIGTRNKKLRYSLSHNPWLS